MSTELYMNALGYQWIHKPVLFDYHGKNHKNFVVGPGL